jgi:SAM-dependent methyltransferase
MELAMSTPHIGPWAAGDAYERYMGRWSRRLVARFLDWLHLPHEQAWLDVGCGTGALSAGVLAHCAPMRVIGIDSSQGFVAHARALVTDGRASFQEADAQALPFENELFDVAAAALVLNFLPKPALAVEEMRRVVRKQGTVAACVWDYAGGGLQMAQQFWNAASALNPAAVSQAEAMRFPQFTRQGMEDLLRHAGLDAVRSVPLEIETAFRDFDDYWAPFLGGTGPAPAYATALPEEARNTLRERLRAALPPGPDGHIVLHARAWAVRGTVV